ncbi:MAG: ribosome biogenesis GTPase Der [bacterium]
MPLPVVTIVGRPNVGKSTFFNRLVGKRQAIVDGQPGVTRDRIYASCTWDERSFLLVDTGGMELDAREDLSVQMQNQTDMAVNEADLVLYVMDAIEGLLGMDREIIQRLYRGNKKVLFVINKADVSPARQALQDFYELGAPFFPISAEHGLGISELMDAVLQQLPSYPARPQEDEKGIRVAIIGRPNVGKSSLVNSLLRKDRMLVTDIPGTTRDAVNSYLRYNNRQYILIDTAGIRKKGKTELALEKYSIISALKHLQGCDIALILIDAVEKTTKQDTTIAGYAYEAGKPCILVVNKWDLIEKDNKTMAAYIDRIRYELTYLSFAPIVFVSARTGQRVFTLFPLIETLYDQYSSRVSTGELNRITQKIIQNNPPPLHHGRRIKFYYQTQVSTKPPTFLFFVNYPEAIHFSYARYLQNQLRAFLKMENIPVKIYFRKREKSPHVSSSAKQ